MYHYKRYELKPHFFNCNYLDTIVQNLNNSEYYGQCKTDLNGEVFYSDKVFGFSIIFRKDHLPCVKKMFPYLSDYFDKIILPGTNSYYVNYLVIQDGKKVKTHIDDTLTSYFTSKRKTTENAKYVTVLYLTIADDMKGGELKLKNHKNKKIKKQKNIVKPQKGLFVLFDGNLYHSVRKFKSSNVRASLVCEQYDLNNEELKTMHPFTILNQSNNKKIRICDKNHGFEINHE